MNGIRFLYKKKKLYAMLSGIVVMALIILSIFTVLDPNNQNNVSTMIFVIGCVLIAIYTIYRILQIKKLDYFLYTDSKGVYTNESFVFCSWNNIRDIDLRRYMGYQTIFFEVKSENLETKIKPVHRNGKSYYCLPLADCAGKPKEVLSQLKRVRKKSKKNLGD